MSSISLIDALKTLRSVRTDRHVVIPTMAAAREWPALGTHPLDFIYAPSAMGQAPLVGLGVALAQPEKQVLVLNGDGSLLMNLGCLVTITAAGPKNLVLIVFDNGVYEVTGLQWTPAAPAARGQAPAADFCEIARGCGFASVHEFDTLKAWRDGVAKVLASTGPTFVSLKVEPVPGGTVPRSPAPPRQRALEFARALQNHG
ncbi:MAG: thiamine pyrophosphate-dependent enzyme [Planctomycetaceae bacterium]